MGNTPPCRKYLYTPSDNVAFSSKKQSIPKGVELEVVSTLTSPSPTSSHVTDAVFP